MNKELQENVYALLDRRNVPIARGQLENSKDAPEWRVLVLDNKIDEVLDHDEIQLIPMGETGTALLGKIIRSRNNSIILKKLQKLDSNMRRNLRMATDFESFLYPLTGAWRGRREIKANDLSCGGISFFCEDAMQEGERCEVVIPITNQPLIVQCEILRQKTLENGETLYATKFIEMCHDEEMMIREAVFSVQVNTRTRSTGT